MSIESAKRTSSAAPTTPLDIRRPQAPRCVTTFLVGRNPQGQWVACDQHGLRGGLFANRACAIRYALSENGRRQEAVILVSGFLELHMSTKPSFEQALAGAALGDIRRAA